MYFIFNYFRLPTLTQHQQRIQQVRLGNTNIQNLNPQARARILSTQTQQQTRIMTMVQNSQSKLIQNVTAETTVAGKR